MYNYLLTYFKRKVRPNAALPESSGFSPYIENNFRLVANIKKKFP
jgi:hypothetical protein